MVTAKGGIIMQHKQVLDELDYYRSQKIAEYLYHMNLITFEEFDMLTRKNRQSFSPVLVELLPNVKQTETIVSETEWRSAV